MIDTFLEKTLKRELKPYGVFKVMHYPSVGVYHIEWRTGHCDIEESEVGPSRVKDITTILFDRNPELLL